MKGTTTERDPPPIGPNGLFTHIEIPLLFRSEDFPSATSLYVYRYSSLPVLHLLPVSWCGPRLIVKSELLRNQLEFLSIGKTIEQEVLIRLSEPEHQYEGGTVLTYELREDTNHRLHLADKKSQSGDGFVWRPGPLKPGAYHLILTLSGHIPRMILWHTSAMILFPHRTFVGWQIQRVFILHGPSGSMNRRS